MKAILIDPKARTVESIDVADKLEAIYAALGCECINELRIDAQHVLYLDDEGLYASRCDFFALGFPGPLANRALVLGFDSHGNSTDCKLDIEAIRRAVIFLAPDDALLFAQRYDAQALVNAETARGQGVGFVHVMRTAPLVLEAIQRTKAQDGDAPPRTH